MKQITIISPRLAIQKGDFLGSGVPYWPVEAATLASFLMLRGQHVEIIDLFGSEPWTLEDRGEFFMQGRTITAYLNTPAIQNSELVIIYAISYMSHGEIVQIIEKIKQVRPELQIAVLENSQAVTAYALPHVAESLFAAGASALLCGEPYWNWDEIAGYLEGGTGVGPPPALPENVMVPGSDRGAVQRKYHKVLSLPVPAWERYPVHNYWKIPYAHGPKSARYLPILTSRGCPFPCDFCVVPQTNDRRWRGRSAEEVVQEILALRDRFGVADFHLEDLNPTVQDARIVEICERLIAARAGIRFYIVSGTKAETVKIENLPLMAEAGCRYISISPESGSSELMRVIGKLFDYEHGVRLVRECKRNGISTQACFVVGHPAETEEHHAASREYLKALLSAGLSEAAFFIVAPFAGSKLHREQKISVEDKQAFISFSPKGRENYQALERRRSELMRDFFLGKLQQGGDLWLQGLRALFGTPRTKMENLPKRVVYIVYLQLRHKLLNSGGRVDAGSEPKGAGRSDPAPPEKRIANFS